MALLPNLKSLSIRDATCPSLIALGLAPKSPLEYQSVALGSGEDITEDTKIVTYLLRRALEYTGL
mgnify:FL=1